MIKTKRHITSFLLLLFFISCSEQHLFPEKISKKIPLSELHLDTEFTNVQADKKPVNKDILELLKVAKMYNNINVNFVLKEFESQWESVSSKNNYAQWNIADSMTWCEITGLLLEITGEAKYAEMLEFIFTNKSNDVQQIIAPYILTKRIDHIYLNLFNPVEINYPHTLGGDVSFKQETDYPNSGSVKLHFGMTERRYMELFIRIPSWAEGTTVTVKQVKYFAAPGTYCKIAKKWKEGDLVEIEFPIDKYNIEERP